jgi:hypothetical protein
MKKIIFLIIALTGLIAILITSTSCIGYVVGVGSLADKEYSYTGFNNIEISSFLKFDISRSDSYRVVVSTYQNVFEYLDISQSGGTLIVRFKLGKYNNDTKVTITMPEINQLKVSGASTGSIKGFQSTNPYDLEVSGASQLDMDVEAGQAKIESSGATTITGRLIAQNAQINVSGASGCEISGSTGSGNIEVSGASHFDSPNFQMQNTDINISGASRASIYTKGTLNLELSGASTLDYSGNPILSKVDISGASKINSK